MLTGRETIGMGLVELTSTASQWLAQRLFGAGEQAARSRAVEALLTTGKPSAAARAAGVRLERVHSWLKEEDFRRAYLHARRALVNGMITTLETGEQTALVPKVMPEVGGAPAMAAGLRAREYPPPLPQRRVPVPAEAPLARSSPVVSMSELGENHGSPLAPLSESSSIALTARPPQAPWMPEEFPRPRNFSLVCSKLRSAQSRTELGQVTLDFVREFWPRAVFLRRRANRLSVWMSSDRSTDEGPLAQVDVDLAEYSTLQQVWMRSRVHHGPLGDSPEDRLFKSCLAPQSTPQSSFLLPVCVGARPICLLYCDSGGQRAPTGDMSELYRLGPELERGFERLIRALKVQGEQVTGSFRVLFR